MRQRGLERGRGSQTHGWIQRQLPSWRTRSRAKAAKSAGHESARRRSTAHARASWRKEGSKRSKDMRSRRRARGRATVTGNPGQEAFKSVGSHQVRAS